jgi:hypothetical protein
MTDHVGASVRLVCPNEREEGHESLVSYQLIVRRTRTGATFRCSDCLTAFSMTEAQVRRVLVRRAVL